MLHTLNNFFPVRYTAFFLCVLGLLLSGFTMLVFGVGGGWALVFTGLVALGVYDLRQTKRSILRNYPIIGHIRFMLEYVRPEIRSISWKATARPRRSRGRSARWCSSAPRATLTSALLARSWRCTPRAMNG
jgi:hypothetical protein